MYSQNNEEKIILDYFWGCNPKDMNLLDIGANDGQTFSNSLALIQAGWNGILLEPSPKAYSKLSSLHAKNKNVLCLNYGISLTSGQSQFYESGGYDGGNDVALYSSISSNEIQRWNGKVEFEEISVFMKTWIEFLSENKVKGFDFITIDIEGHDLDILTQMDLSYLNCKMLIAEWNSVSDVGINMVNFCNQHGLREISRNAENIIFAR